MRNVRTIIGIVLFVILTGVHAAMGETAAILTETEGDVEVVRGDKSGTVKGAIGLAIAPGDVVEVGSGGRAVLLFRTGTMKRLGSGERYPVPQKTEAGPSLAQGIAATLGEMIVSGREGPTVHGMARDIVGVAPITPWNTVMLNGEFVFRWTGPPEISRYTVIVTVDDDTSFVRQREVKGDSLVSTAFDLQTGKVYRWRVEGRGLQNVSVVSQKGWFRVMPEDEQRSLQKQVAEVERLAGESRRTQLLLTAGLYTQRQAYEEAERLLEQTITQSKGVVERTTELDRLVGRLRDRGRIEPLRWALLIGVGEYDVPKYKLNGPPNDVMMLKEVLIERFGFPEERIRVVLDKEATKEGIIGAVRTVLIDQAGPDDTVLFYFSGHGTHRYDNDGDEEDGLDEAICPVDVTPQQADRAILDDELATLFRQVRAKDLTVILDACHSGTGMRGGNGTPKYISLEVTRGREETGKDGITDGNRAVTFLSACRAEEVSMDAVFYEGGVKLHAGAFTYNLLQNLRKAGRGTTYATLMTDIQRDVRRSFEQSPQIEGAIERPLFRVVGAGKPSIRVLSVQGDRVVFNAGASSGITGGSLYAIFPPDEQEFSGDGIGKVAVTTVESATATATLLERRGEIVPGCRAVERGHSFTGDPLLLRRGYSRDPDLDRLVVGLGFVEFAQGEIPGDFLLIKEEATGRISLQLIDGDRRGTKVEGRTIGEAFDLLNPQLENAYKIKWLSKLDNPNPPFRVQIEGTGGMKYVVMRVGEFIAFEFTAEKDCYGAIVAVDVNGKVEVLFPNEWNRQNRLVGGRRYSTGDIGFKILAEPPPGKQLVKLIASERPFDLTRPWEMQLGGKAAQALIIDPTQTTGGVVKPVSLTDWATDYLIVEIK